MEIISEHNEGTLFTLKLAGTEEDKTTNVIVKFNLEWSLQKEIPDSQKDISFLHIGDEQDFPYDVRQDFKTIPCHIPSSKGREIFKACLDYFSKVSLAPVHIGFAQHPGYPLTLVTYDAVMMSKEQLISIILTVNEAIENASIISESVQLEQEVMENEDFTDESIIIDYEEDPELKALIKQPQKTEYLPMEGNEID